MAVTTDTLFGVAIPVTGAGVVLPPPPDPEDEPPPEVVVPPLDVVPPSPAVAPPDPPQPASRPAIAAAQARRASDLRNSISLITNTSDIYVELTFNSHGLSAARPGKTSGAPCACTEAVLHRRETGGADLQDV